MTFFTLAFFIKVISAVIASLGFAMMFKMDSRHLPYGVFSAAITFIIYYAIEFFGGALFAAAFISTAFAALFSEVMARVKRAPVIIFLLPGVIPTVPGGNLYYAMRYLLLSDTALALKNFTAALEVGLGIAGGTVATSIIFGMTLDAVRSFKKRKNGRKGKINTAQ